MVGGFLPFPVSISYMQVIYLVVSRIRGYLFNHFLFLSNTFLSTFISFETIQVGSSGSGLSKVGHLFSYFSSQDDLLSGVRLRSFYDDGDHESSLRSGDKSAVRFPVLIIGTKLDLLNKSVRGRFLRQRADANLPRWFNQTSRTHQRSWSCDPVTHLTSHSRDDCVFINLSSNTTAASDKSLGFAAEYGFPEILLVRACMHFSYICFVYEGSCMRWRS